jgi:hypothetical protein
MAVTQITNHVELAQSRLMTRLADSTTIKDLLDAYVQEIQTVEDALIDTRDQRALSDATGEQLDGLGQLLGVTRNQDTDTVYRLRLQAKILANTASGTKPELIKLIKLMYKITAAYLALSASEQATVDSALSVRIEEYDPATFVVNLRGLGVTTDDLALLGNAVASITPAGVRSTFTSKLQGDTYEFRFATSYGSSDSGSNYGFGSGAFVGYAEGQV